jgi:hypothetical protein
MQRGAGKGAEGANQTDTVFGQSAEVPQRLLQPTEPSPQPRNCIHRESHSALIQQSAAALSNAKFAAAADGGRLRNAEVSAEASYNEDGTVAHRLQRVHEADRQQI